MLDFDVEFDEARREPVKWVSVAPPVSQRVQDRLRSTGPRKNRARQLPDSGPKAPQQPQKERETRRTRKARAKRELPGGKLDDDVLTDVGDSSGPGSGDAPGFGRENDAGNVEYKLRLKSLTPIRFQQLATQMKFRLAEGNGECFYYLGVEDNGNLLGIQLGDLATSLDTLRALAHEVGATATVVRQLPCVSGRACAIARVARHTVQHLSCTDLRIAVAGSVDSGKSTLVACLTHGIRGRPLLDDGRGSARMAVFRHKHEIESGRTSSLSQQLLGYAADGSVLNYSGVAALTIAEISQAAAHVLRFIDLGGHERYLKTALYGMTCMLPDAVLLAVCGVRGIGRVGRQHLAVALALELPLVVVVTKADVAGPRALAALTAEISDVLVAATKGSLQALRLDVSAPVVASGAQAAALAAGMHGNRMSSLVDAGGGTLTVPIFHVSSVTGAGLPLMHAFLRQLPAGGWGHSSAESRASPADSRACGGSGDSGTAQDAADEPAHFQVDHTFEVRNVGSVVSGTAVAGSISLGQRLLLGPNAAGHFSSVVVSCIQRSAVPVGSVKAGQSATLAIHPSPRTPPLGSDAAGADGSNGTSTADGAADAVSSPTADSAATKGEPAPGCSSEVLAAAGDERHPDRSGGDDGSEPRALADTSYRIRDGALGAKTSSVMFAEPEEVVESAFAVAISSERFVAAEAEAEGLPEESAWLQDLQLERERNAVPWLRSVSQHSVRAGGSSPVVIPNRGGGGGNRDASCPVRTGSAPSLLGTSPTNVRKGAVLLDAALQPRTIWEFEAVLVLLSGHWPARGLLSGQWPPNEDGPHSEDSSSGIDERPRNGSASLSAPGALSSDGGASPRGGAAPDARRDTGTAAGAAAIDGAPDDCSARRRHARQRGRLGGSRRRCGGSAAAGLYLPVVHCGSVRQAARVVSMREVSLDAALGSSLASALAAAAAMLDDSSGDDDGCPDGGEHAGCATAVTLQFVHRPEWLQEGARLILRSCGDGCAAGAGIVQALHWGVSPPENIT